VGVRHTETSLIVWASNSAEGTDKTKTAEPVIPVFDATRLYDAGDRGFAMGPLDDVAAVMLSLQPGQTLEINALDPTVEVDLAAWCRMTGHQVIEKQTTRYLIKHK